MNSGRKPARYAGLDNRDLRLRNIKDEDLLFYRHKIFIVTFQRAGSIREVAKKLHMTPRTVIRKAHNLRRKNIPLKFFSDNYRLPKELLAKLREVALSLKADQNQIDHKKFVRLWQTKPLKKVAKELDIPKIHASRLAAYLRNILKIPLRRFRERQLDAPALHNLAKSLASAPPPPK